jgi:NAD(P)-dependent dehydrogenase (short-subunit alcohol dehydrogenase family)
MSKTSLNQLSVTIAKELQQKGDNIAVVALYPGHLATRMSNYNYSHDMDECIAGAVDVIEKIDMSQTGTYVNWKNETVPW